MIPVLPARTQVNIRFIGPIRLVNGMAVPFERVSDFRCIDCGFSTSDAEAMQRHQRARDSWKGALTHWWKMRTGANKAASELRLLK